jgi:hypothetical protein
MYDRMGVCRGETYNTRSHIHRKWHNRPTTPACILNVVWVSLRETGGVASSNHPIAVSRHCTLPRACRQLSLATLTRDESPVAPVKRGSADALTISCGSKPGAQLAAGDVPHAHLAPHRASGGRGGKADDVTVLQNCCSPPQALGAFGHFSWRPLNPYSSALFTISAIVTHPARVATPPSCPTTLASLCWHLPTPRIGWTS